MKKIYLVLSVMVLLLVSFVYAIPTFFCYQETANDSSITSTNPTLADGDCRQIYNGSYSFNDTPTDHGNAFDGDWNSFIGSIINPKKVYFVNYTIPALATNDSLLMVKQGSAGQFNLTINSSCFKEDKLEFRLFINQLPDIYLITECNDGSNWITIGNTSPSTSNTFREEAMWWNIEIGIDNCTSFNTTVLTISGKDEETDIDVNLSLNILLEPKNSTGTNGSFELSGKTSYNFCSNKNLTIDSIMEYGDDIIYTDRKYYLNDFQIDTSTIAEVILYHLNNSKASEIVFTVFDTTTGDRVSEAFIKILRYYPGQNVFRTVEIAKTDEVGQTLGKMVLADVFYKFIIEKPAGTVKLDTDVLRILSLTRSFGISFVEDVLATWDKIHGVSFSTTCTKGTKTCRVTWSDSSNIVQSVTLEVWRVTGLVDTLLSSQTTTASAGTISYTVVEDTLTNTYEARAFARSTNPSDWNFGRASFFDSDNPFFTDPTHRLASLFPLFLLMVVIIFALIDWGVVGVVVGSLLGMVIGSIVGILPISPFYLISFVLMGVILIFKLSK